MSVSRMIEIVVEFVRPAEGRRALGQAHVPLLALMPRQ